MKHLTSIAIAAAVVAALLTSSTPPASAQKIEGGFLGSINEGVRSGTTFGLGGRIGAYAFRTGAFDWKVDGGFDYFFAACSEAIAETCFAWHGHADLLATRNLAQPIYGYLGIGAVYQRFRVRSGDTDATGDAAGVNLTLGAKLPATRSARPFFEVRGVLLSGAEDQLVVSVGLLFGSGPTEPSVAY